MKLRIPQPNQLLLLVALMGFVAAQGLSFAHDANHTNFFEADKCVACQIVSHPPAVVSKSPDLPKLRDLTIQTQKVLVFASDGKSTSATAIRAPPFLL